MVWQEARFTKRRVLGAGGDYRAKGKGEEEKGQWSRSSQTGTQAWRQGALEDEEAGLQDECKELTSDAEELEY